MSRVLWNNCLLHKAKIAGQKQHMRHPSISDRQCNSSTHSTPPNTARECALPLPYINSQHPEQQIPYGASMTAQQHAHPMWVPHRGMVRAKLGTSNCN